jgi:mono/diheme cytochrome c family protein
LGGFAIVAFACNDELTEEVPKQVCYSQMRWIGEKRGSPEMFPGRDCVGCHLDNDGPPLAVGGTIYPYVLNAPDVLAAQTGEDCYGVEGVNITITDANGQEFNLTTNRAGNFYVEGNPDDFAKPFSAIIDAWGVKEDGAINSSPMGTRPYYGGCAKCHTPGKEAYPPPVPRGEPQIEFPPDEEVRPTSKIGLPGNGPGADGFNTIENELRSFLPPEPEDEE